MGVSRSETGQRAPARQVDLIPVLRDNYIFVLSDGAEAVVVDPAVADPVIDWLEQRGLELVAVLQTHHHSDHIGGTPALLRRWPAAAVIAAAADRDRIPFQTQPVAGGDRLTLLGRSVEVIAVPGHTRTHLAFHLPATGEAGAELFCGDTLFAGGCGRLFEGTPAQMHQSLQRFAALPEETRVWCAHEYTLANLRWAAASGAVSGMGTAIRERLFAVEALRRSGRPTIPSTIALEKATNLFLAAPDAGRLALLRRSKDQWS